MSVNKTKMGLSFVFVFLMMFSGKALAEEPLVFHEEWQSCKEDSECVIVRKWCGWESVNGKFREDAESYYRTAREVLMGVCFQDSYYGRPKAFCSKGSCAYQLDETIKAYQTSPYNASFKVK